jgi:pyruvate dehydrogenase E1 component alpha subunit
MKTDWTPESLVAFELDIADAFNRGEIKAPIHLAGGNELQLMGIFEQVRPQDWVCCTWRSHLHCLLKGVPPGDLKAAILDGRSIALCFPEQRVISSALVGGIAPIALGLAWAAKRKGSGERVWCFLGDMAARGGLYHECAQYASGHALPVTFVVEDNGLSVATDTERAWGLEHGLDERNYSYKLDKPHVGTGVFVKFPDVEHRSHGL